MTNYFNNLNGLELEITEYLKSYCSGISHSISNEALAGKFDMDKRTMRDMIAHLVTDHHIPIGSCSRNNSGVFYCVSREDFEVASRELMSRIKNLSKRHKGLRIGFVKSIEVEQLSLMGVE